eukprot:scaffold223654_cov19-Tisochrysis_lutea.AAC.1
MEALWSHQWKLFGCFESMEACWLHVKLFDCVTLREPDRPQHLMSVLSSYMHLHRWDQRRPLELLRFCVWQQKKPTKIL